MKANICTACGKFAMRFKSDYGGSMIFKCTGCNMPFYKCRCAPLYGQKINENYARKVA